MQRRKAKQGRQCKDCHARIESGQIYVIVDNYRWICTNCAEHFSAPLPANVKSEVHDVPLYIVKRVAAAHEIAEYPETWLQARGHDGTKFYGIMSQSQPKRLQHVVYHLANCRSCDCQDFKHRFTVNGPETLPCKHILAVKMHVRKCRGEEADPVVLALTPVEVK